MRMRQPGAGSRDVPSQGPSLRAQASGMAPPPPPGARSGPPLGVPSGAPGRDAQIGQIFRNMRATLQASRETLARRLATTPGVIEDLENGSVASLPHWRETVRIVRSYCELLRLNPDPLLWRIDQLLRSGAGAPGAEEALARPASPPPLALRKPPSRERVPRERSAGVGRLLLLATPPVVVAAAASLAILVPGPIYRTIPLLPPSVAEPARAGLDLFVLYSAPRRDGLRWIDVGDPKLRKGDKLRTKPR
jgi:DNA-binding XRE family transcriptional regulator